MYEQLLKTNCSSFIKDFPGTFIVSFQDIPLTKKWGVSPLIALDSEDSGTQSVIDIVDTTMVIMYGISYTECIYGQTYSTTQQFNKQAIQNIYALFPANGYKVFPIKSSNSKDLMLDTLVDLSDLDAVDIMRGVIDSKSETAIRNYFKNKLQKPVPFNKKQRNFIYANKWVYINLPIYLGI